MKITIRENIRVLIPCQGAVKLLRRLVELYYGGLKK